jgi:hypothetical protein
MVGEQVGVGFGGSGWSHQSGFRIVLKNCYCDPAKRSYVFRRIVCRWLPNWQVIADAELCLLVLTDGVKSICGRVRLLPC